MDEATGAAHRPKPRTLLRLPHLTGIERARIALRPHAAETPLVRSELLSRALAAEVWLKNETVSPIASFKLRGALTALLRAREAGAAAGAVTSSTGNHGQGVAYAARAMGMAAHVFLPLGASPVKRRMIEALGATIHEGGADLDEAKDDAQRFAAAHHLLFVDDGESLDVMEGAGTIGLEIAERLPEVGTLLVPMGSGTLAVGCAVGLKGLQPRARVVAVQSSGSPAMVESFHARHPLERAIDTVADGLVCRVPARLALEGLWTWVDDAVTVPDAALLQALRALVEHAHVLVEPAGAAALAAAWARRSDLRGQRVVLVLTGANATLPILKDALSAPPLDAGNLDRPTA
ncbi:MAG TPA: pyridoxal-phosphate dependent enzyme [Methylomirabilota bacterium]|jgi:threonine dehydratase|nr:pyridoxal-phosphate dependent enzyme [Methylomirabilota bacterium]